MDRHPTPPEPRPTPDDDTSDSSSRPSAEEDPASWGSHQSGQESRRVVRSAYLIGGLTLVSRLTGLLREAVQARFLGTGIVADAFRFAILIPNMLRRLVG